MKKFWSKFLTLTMIVAILSTCLVGLVACGPKKTEPVDPVANSKCVNIDINPNIDLVVDADNKVIGVVANNEDAERLLVQANIANKAVLNVDVNTAVDNIVSLSVSMEYLNKDNKDVKILAVNASGSIDTTLVKELGARAEAAGKAAVAKLDSTKQFIVETVTEVTNSVNRRLEAAKAEIKASTDEAAKKAAENLTAAKLLLMETVEELSNGAVTLVEAVKMDVVELNRVIYELTQEIGIVARGVVADIELQAAKEIEKAEELLNAAYKDALNIKAQASLVAKNLYVDACNGLAKTLNAVNELVQKAKEYAETAPNTFDGQKELERNVKAMADEIFTEEQADQKAAFLKSLESRTEKRYTYRSVIAGVENYYDTLDKETDHEIYLKVETNLGSFESSFSTDIDKEEIKLGLQSALESAQKNTAKAAREIVKLANAINKVIGLPDLTLPEIESFTTYDQLVKFMVGTINEQTANVEVAFAKYVDEQLNEEQKAAVVECQKQIDNAKATAKKAYEDHILSKIPVPYNEVA